jgi:hypothetical protein
VVSVFNAEPLRIGSLRTVLMNSHPIEAARRAGVERYFLSSCPCACSKELQKDPNTRFLWPTSSGRESGFRLVGTANIFSLPCVLRRRACSGSGSRWALSERWTGWMNN